MNEKLQKAWEEAESTGQSIDIGNIVVCDGCDEDYTNREDKGGVLFQSKAYCPVCTKKVMEDARKYHEEHFIRAYAKYNESFKDFVLRIRGGNNTIQIRSLEL